MCERTPFFLLHSLTNQKMITNKSFALLLHSDRIYQFSQDKIQFVLAWIGLKQARSWFRFPREFFVSGFTWSVRAPSVVLVWRLETAA